MGYYQTTTRTRMIAFTLALLFASAFSAKIEELKSDGSTMDPKDSSVLSQEEPKLADRIAQAEEKPEVEEFYPEETEALIAAAVEEALIVAAVEEALVASVLMEAEMEAAEFMEALVQAFEE